MNKSAMVECEQACCCAGVGTGCVIRTKLPSFLDCFSPQLNTLQY